MSIESETGDLLVRVILDGGERMIRLSGSAAMMSGKPVSYTHLLENVEWLYDINI